MTKHDTMTTADQLRDPLLGEWACLGILYDQPAHGWAIVKQLRPDGDIGRIWYLSRPLTYRALDQLATRGWIEPVGEERGSAGPNRTILAVTRAGRANFRSWLRTPIPHLRDLRSELLLKLVFADQHHIDIGEMLDRQRDVIDGQARILTEAANDSTGHDERDVVALWRIEATHAAQRFLDQIHPASNGPQRST